MMLTQNKVTEWRIITADHFFLLLFDQISIVTSSNNTNRYNTTIGCCVIQVQTVVECRVTDNNLLWSECGNNSEQ